MSLAVDWLALALMLSLTFMLTPPAKVIPAASDSRARVADTVRYEYANGGRWMSYTGPAGESAPNGLRPQSPPAWAEPQIVMEPCARGALTAASYPD